MASDFYLWDYDVFEAGSSYDPDAKLREPGAIVGPAFVLPGLAAGERAPCPELPAGLRSAASGPLLADCSAFVRFIAGRTFKLGKRTNGLNRADLAEANARMTRPLELNLRCVQPQVPRVHVCFRVAEALGLLEVDEDKHRTVGHPDAAAFAELPESERWWAVVEALWQRVRWKGLSMNVSREADGLQAYRASLGERLAKPFKPLDLLRLPWGVEVFGSVLLPSWRDAGLVELQYEDDSRYAKLREFEFEGAKVTLLGRWAFERLAEQSPRLDEEEGQEDQLEPLDDFEDDDFEDDDLFEDDDDLGDDDFG
ncbi:MAG TPA: hypothetical protein DFS52_30125 [Myxococcales bacterium]|nr:hypothetical protein [Myxococcales bacterium]